MDLLMRAICEGDLRALIIAGEPTAEDLFDAWSDLFNDFLDGLGDNQHKYRQSLESDIGILDSNLQVCELCLGHIQPGIVILSRLPQFIAHLRDLGFTDHKFDTDDLYSYKKDLEDIFYRSREWKIDLQLKIIELNELMDSLSKEPEKKADRKFFLNILSHIATYKKVAVIHTSEISGEEFCSMFSEYMEHNKAVKRSRNKPVNNG